MRGDRQYSFEKQDNRLIVTGEGETVWIEPYGEDRLRVRATRGREIVENDWTLLPPPKASARISISDDKATIYCERLSCEVKNDGSLKFVDRVSGGTLIEELWIDHRVNNAELLKARNYKPLSSELFKIQVYFKAFDNERFYGMGQYANGYLNLKGCVLELAHRNTQISIPFLISTRGYGFVWNNPSIGRAELAKNHTMFQAEAARQIDYIVIAGSTIREIVRKYMDQVLFQSFQDMVGGIHAT